jgi:hypothetical protein
MRSVMNTRLKAEMAIGVRVIDSERRCAVTTISPRG